MNSIKSQPDAVRARPTAIRNDSSGTDDIKRLLPADNPLVTVEGLRALSDEVEPRQPAQAGRAPLMSTGDVAGVRRGMGLVVTITSTSGRELGGSLSSWPPIPPRGAAT